jgi:hypothetical protein
MNNLFSSAFSNKPTVTLPAVEFTSAQEIKPGTQVLLAQNVPSLDTTGIITPEAIAANYDRTIQGKEALALNKIFSATSGEIGRIASSPGTSADLKATLGRVITGDITGIVSDSSLTSSLNIEPKAKIELANAQEREAKAINDANKQKVLLATNQIILEASTLKSGIADLRKIEQTQEKLVAHYNQLLGHNSKQSIQTDLAKTTLELAKTRDTIQNKQLELAEKLDQLRLITNNPKVSLEQIPIMHGPRIAGTELREPAIGVNNSKTYNELSDEQIKDRIKASNPDLLVQLAVLDKLDKTLLALLSSSNKTEVKVNWLQSFIGGLAGAAGGPLGILVGIGKGVSINKNVTDVREQVAQIRANIAQAKVKIETTFNSATLEAKLKVNALQTNNDAGNNFQAIAVAGSNRSQASSNEYKRLDAILNNNPKTKFNYTDLLNAELTHNIGIYESNQHTNKFMANANGIDYILGAYSDNKPTDQNSQQLPAANSVFNRNYRLHFNLTTTPAN